MPDSTTTKESAAINSLEAAGYTYHGGSAWRPPLGERRPTVASLAGWTVGITDSGTNEIRILLVDNDEAIGWALWLTERAPKEQTP